MNILYSEEKTQKDSYKFTINQGGDLGIKMSNGADRYVVIVFVNGKLESVCYDLCKFDLRSDWYVYGAIAEKIKEIENKYRIAKKE